jgi:hypothetical protein
VVPDPGFLEKNQKNPETEETPKPIIKDENVLKVNGNVMFTCEHLSAKIPDPITPVSNHHLTFQFFLLLYIHTLTREKHE